MNYELLQYKNYKILANKANDAVEKKPFKKTGGRLFELTKQWMSVSLLKTYCVGCYDR